MHDAPSGLMHRIIPGLMITTFVHDVADILCDRESNQIPISYVHPKHGMPYYHGAPVGRLHVIHSHAEVSQLHERIGAALWGQEASAVSVVTDSCPSLCHVLSCSETCNPLYILFLKLQWAGSLVVSASPLLERVAMMY